MNLLRVIFIIVCVMQASFSSGEDLTFDNGRWGPREELIGDELKEALDDLSSATPEQIRSFPLPLLTMMAENENEVAQAELGRRYDFGHGVEENDDTAFKWFHKAADNGDAWAQQRVSMAYMRGAGIEKNIEQGLAWLQKSAMQGHPNAQYALGMLFLEDQHVPKDAITAAQWIQRAVL